MFNQGNVRAKIPRLISTHTYINFVSFNPDLPLGYGCETCQNLGRTQTNITYRIPTYI